MILRGITMKLIYKDEATTLARNELAFEQIFKKVNKLMEKELLIFSHLIVDGAEVYNNHEQYINERLHNIAQIEIVMRTTKEMIHETMVSIYNYLTDAIPSIQNLVEQSYSGFQEETWNNLAQLVEGMEHIVSFINFTRKVDEKPSNWEQINDAFSTCEQQFKTLLTALEQQDTIEITFILSSGIQPAYEQLKSAINAAINDKIH